MQSFSRWSQQVSDEGDVLYVFPKDYRSKLAAKSFRMKIEPLVDKTKVLDSSVLSLDMNNVMSCLVLHP